MNVSLLGPNVITLCGQTCTAAGLARATGLSRSFLSYLLRGKRKPSEESLHLLAKALGVSPSALEQELEERNA